MSYEITIKETRAVTKMAGKDWEVVGQVEKPRERTMYEDRDSEPRTYIANEYGYTPEIVKETVETREVLKQTVDELDIAAVIRAVNKLDG